MSVPFHLRANDINKHILNIDSRHRDTPYDSRPTNFYYSLLTPVKNVLRVRVTSIEFPNNYFYFTKRRGNVSFEILYDKAAPKSYVIEIEDGNYLVSDMLAAIRADLAAADPSTPMTWLTVDFDTVNGAFTFTGTQAFAINTVYGSKNRAFDYGLGYNLGFTRKCHLSKKIVAGSKTTYTVTSDQAAYFAGDSYIFLQVNDFSCVRQTIHTYDNTGRTIQDEVDFTALAKVVLRQPKNYMTFDDYASQHAKEVVFKTPVDLSRLQVRVLDAYGDELDLGGGQWSFSLEVLEIENTTLYNAIRDSVALQYV